MLRISRYTIYFSLIVLLLSACFKEDEAVKISSISGKVDTLKKNIEHYFSYFNFEAEGFVEYMDANAWELAFASNSEGFQISINSGAGWFIGKTPETKFNKITGFDLDWKWDNQAFYPDSTAVGKWFKIDGLDTNYTDQIYVLADNLSGTFTAKFELKFLKVNPDEYIFAYSSLESNNIDTISIKKSPDKSIVYYSLINNQFVNEPNKDDYDIVFGPYYEGLDHNQTIVPYLVRGVLLNPELTMVCVDSVSKFDDIQIQHMHNYEFSQTRNFIGYEWKEPIIDFESNKAVYKVRSDYVFLVKTSTGAYFKFKFLNYALKGENGYPSFQYEKLEY
jgi:hypothetical protein